MTKARKTRVEHEAEQGVDMNPMLDVVFILLIFFIVTAAFVDQDGLNINRPQSSNNINQEAKALTIQIDAQNRLFINQRQVDMLRLAANLERLIAEHPISAVTIKADANALHNTVTQVMNTVKEVEDMPLSISSEVN